MGFLDKFRKKAVRTETHEEAAERQRQFAASCDGMSPEYMGGLLMTTLSSDSYEETRALTLIEKGAKLDGRDGSGLSLLMLAVWYNRPKIVGALLDRNVDTDLQDRWGSTALSRAVSAVVQHGASLDATRMLIEKGADLDKKDDGGNTPLMLAIQSGKQDLITLLREAPEIQRQSAATQSSPPKSSDPSGDVALQRNVSVGRPLDLLKK